MHRLCQVVEVYEVSNSERRPADVRKTAMEFVHYIEKSRLVYACGLSFGGKSTRYPTKFASAEKNKPETLASECI